jgi:competence protein ComGF
MKLNKNISAFTILEVTLGMVITGILIATVYIAYNFLIQQSYKEIELKNDVSKWVIFRQRFLENVYLAEHIQIEGDGIKIDHHNGLSTVYYIEDEVLYIELKDTVIRVDYDFVEFNFEETEENNVEGTLIVRLREQEMQLYFGSYKDLSSRINDWFITKHLDNDGEE